MRYQVLEQSAPGEPWHFIAHGARMERAEAAQRVASAERLGVRRKAIACGRSSKRKESSN